MFDLEPEPRGKGDVLWKLFATEVESPPDQWALLGGDAIQNFRAALDHSNLHRTLTTVAGWVSEAAIGHDGGEGTITDWDLGT